MATSDRDVVERIRERLPLDRLLAEYGVRLERRGRRLVGLCPFHEERTPSFSVDVEKGLYYCFGCGAGGDAFRFVMEREGVDFPEALAELARRSGVDLARERGREGGRSRLFRALEEAQRYYAAQLRTREGEAARAYLTRRGFAPPVVEEFGFGWAPGGWDRLATHLRRAGFSEDELLRTGLVRRGRRGLIDFLRERIVVPIRDARGRTVAFGGRILAGDAPKYLNTSETELFSKREVLFGFDRLVRSPRGEDPVFVVEGYMDVVAMHAHGFDRTVGVLGTSFTEQHGRLLLRAASSVRLLFDADAAGERAARRAGAAALAAGLDVWVVELPSGRDPDDLLREGGREALARRVERSEPLITHLVRKEREAWPAHPAPATEERSVRRVCSVIAGIGDELRRERAIEAVAREFGLRSDLVRQCVAEARSGAPAGSRGLLPSRRRARLRGWELDEIYVLQGAVANTEAAERAAATLRPSDFRDESRRRVFEAIRRCLARGEGLTVALVDAELSEDPPARRALEECLSRQPPDGDDFGAQIARVVERRRHDEARRLRRSVGAGDLEALERLQRLHRRRIGLDAHEAPEGDAKDRTGRVQRFPEGEDSSRRTNESW